MKKLLLSLVLLLSACVSVPSQPPISSMIDSTAFIKVGTGNGSGVVISQDKDSVTILTAKHVAIEYHGDGFIRLNGRKYEFGKIYLDKEYDVATVTLNTTDQVVVTPLCSKNPKIGSKVWVVGYPYGILSVSSGYVGGAYDSYAKWDGDLGQRILGFTESGSVSFGSSGGPVFTKQGDKYCVAGIVNAMNAQQPGIPNNTQVMVSSVSTIKKILK